MRSNSTSRIQKVLVLGGGSAGFLSAINIKKRNPDVDVVLVRSPAIKIIGVGESTIQTIPKYLHGYLGINPTDFFREVAPTWKLAIRFLWGPRKHFHFSFRPQVDLHYDFLQMPMGFYYEDEFEYGELASSLCAHDYVFARRDDGTPLVGRDWAYHLDNKKLVAFLEKLARDINIEIIDDMVVDVTQDNVGITGLNLESRGNISADLFVDCSGFRSELLGKALGEPFESFKSSLFCDRAVVSEWDRAPGDLIQPYTTAESMNSGWCWQIDHEHHISRGYVYSSDFITDEEAEREFREKNPQAESTHVIKFTSGRFRNAWVKNVVAIGNSSGFVEPLESSALHVICLNAKGVAESIFESRDGIQPSLRDSFNHRNERVWQTLREFLSIHYKFNTRLDTEFWKACRNDADICGAQTIVDYYREHGPSTLWSDTLVDPHDIFRLDGYFTILMGQDVPFRSTYIPTEQELELAREIKKAHRKYASNAIRSEQALEIVRDPNWSWDPGIFKIQG
jgi:tryptophan halogenase